MKRIGRILFCLLPLLLTIGLQNVICIPIFGISAMAVILQNYQSYPLNEVYQKMYAVWTTGSFTVTLSVVYAVVAVAIFGYWYWKKIAHEQEQVPLGQSLNHWILLALPLLAVGLQYITTYLMSFVAVLRPDWMQAYESLMDTVGFDSVSPLLAVYSCIIAPVSEELIFRGVTLGYAKKAMRVIPAVCLQAVLFGVFHLNMIQGIYAAFLGLVLGYVCEAGGTLLIPILLHAFFNIAGVFLNTVLFYRIDQPFFFLLWLTVGVLFTYTGIFLLQYGVRQRDLSIVEQYRQKPLLRTVADDDQGNSAG